jgi:hypothetical protein
MTVSAKERVNVTLPTEQELDAAVTALNEAAEPLVGIAWSVDRVSGADRFDENSPLRRREGDEVPTLEQIGRLFSFVISARGSLAELKGCVDRVENALEQLDGVRLDEADDA